MRVEIQLQPDAALELHRQQDTQSKDILHSQSNVARLVKDVKKLGLTLEPVHPQQTHPLLVPYFMIDVPDRRTAERVVEQLSDNKIVEAAYLQPEESPP